MYFTAHLRFYLCVLLVCLLAEPIGHANGTPLKQLTPPKPTPLKLQPLGETRWTTFSVAPDRRRILVASPERLKLLSANLKTTHWNQETPGTTKLVTFSADGKICAVISYGDTGYSLATHSADDGTLLERVAFRFPNSGGSGRGYQPPDWPKALMPAPNGNGFLIHNAYGTFRVEAGKPEAQPVKANAALGRSAQDATSYWSWNGDQLTQTHGPKKAQIKLDCYPQTYVVDKALNRVVALCHPPKKSRLSCPTRALIRTTHQALSGPKLASSHGVA